MKINEIKEFVKNTIASVSKQEIKALVESVKSKQVTQLNAPSRMKLREVRLSEAEVRPSTTSLERMMGKNDLVDINYLYKAILASNSVCRIILKDNFGREVGFATGFKVSPTLLMTNFHVLPNSTEASNAVAEFNYELDLVGQPNRQYASN